MTGGVTTEQNVDVKKWVGHESQVNDLFKLYHDKINPLISEYNALENSFPIGVINELRDIFSHLTQSLATDKDQDVERHLDKAHRHMKRAAVDAFKYASMAYSKVYDDFKEAYRRVDLSQIDNGKFPPKIAKLNATAEHLMHEARMIESDTEHDEDTMYAAYEKACTCYKKLYGLIMGAMDKAERLSLKADQEEEHRQKEHRIDRWIGIIGVLVGVAGIVIGFFI